MIRRLALGSLILMFLITAPLSAREVAIRVFGLFHPAELQVRPVSGGVLVMQIGGRPVIIEPGEVADLRLDSDRIQCRIGNRPPLEATSASFSSRDGSVADFILAVPGKIHRRYRGKLEITAVSHALQSVVAMDLELAVASVVAAESPPGAPLEALKAQAVVTRSYYAAGAQHRDFDFCDTTHCQFLRQAPAENSLAWQATRQTAGLVLSYQGATVPTMYTASCGGRTRSLAEIGVKARGYPYFSVECKYCQRNPETWSRELSRDEAEGLLKDPSERRRIAVGRGRGWSAVPGNNYRATLAGDRVLLTGAGKGHGVGLCQRGAAGMAGEGATFQEILAHYYPNTTIEPLTTGH
jgi:stage II sporulation protein D